ncbi:MAG: (Fe-S)-binding protein [Deltaproteobacteria bacterium]|nr:(Fe-S)-binding protein [Deltaproteobacteria bacterium]
MPSLKALARLMKELEDQVAVCMRCGLCQTVCPMFAQTGREADLARGKLALLDGLMQELLRDPRAVQDRLTRCLLCGSCAANCPSGVKVLDVFIKARAILGGYVGLSPLKKAVFRKMLAHPDVFNRILSWGAKFQGIFIKPVDDLLGSSCSRFLSPLLQRRHFKPLAPVSFIQQSGSRNTPAGASNLRAALFVGCLVDKVFTGVGDATLKVLERRGVGVFMPETQGCCGIPALSSGDPVAFDKLVRHNLKVFSSPEFDYLVTPCATCTAAIKKIWPLMAQEYPEEKQVQIARLAEKTLDINQFLAETVGLEPGPNGDGPKIPLTYHEPCHLKKSLGVAAPPRALIQANPRYRLQEMAEADWCCGSGGSFSLQHYEISAAIGRRKLENIKKSGAAVVATGCPACMMQLVDMISQAGGGIRVRHVIEIYAEVFN